MSQPVKGVYDPTNVKAARARKCAKCGSTWKSSRHHKANDYIFARVREDLYAERYIQFHPDDIIVLCERCHNKIHKLFKYIQRELNQYLITCVPYIGQDGQIITWSFKPEYSVLESFRKRFSVKCERWLKNKMRKPSRATKKLY